MSFWEQPFRDFQVSSRCVNFEENSLPEVPRHLQNVSTSKKIAFRRYPGIFKVCQLRRRLACQRFLSIFKMCQLQENWPAGGTQASSKCVNFGESWSSGDSSTSSRCVNFEENGLPEVLQHLQNVSTSQNEYSDLKRPHNRLNSTIRPHE